MPFIKCLNHDFYAIQIGEIPLEPKTELEIVLSVFEQRFLDQDKYWLKQYEHVITNDLLRKILRKLQLLANDERVAQEQMVIKDYCLYNDQSATLLLYMIILL